MQNQIIADTLAETVSAFKRSRTCSETARANARIILRAVEAYPELAPIAGEVLEMARMELLDPIKLARAWHIVDPSAGGALPGLSWKDPVNTSATKEVWDKLCKHYDVTFKDILVSIEHYTATAPLVERKADGTIVVSSAGYRAGPAGDH